MSAAPLADCAGRGSLNSDPVTSVGRWVIPLSSSTTVNSGVLAQCDITVDVDATRSISDRSRLNGRSADQRYVIGSAIISPQIGRASPGRVTSVTALRINYDLKGPGCREVARPGVLGRLKWRCGTLMTTALMPTLTASRRGVCSRLDR
jgi:hypothetical protein